MTSEELFALPEVFGLATAARAVGCGRNQAYQMVKRGAFPVRVREVGGRYRVTKADLLAWLGYAQQAPQGQDGQALRAVQGAGS
jgi:predicted DNA-binding transcriptional regulator AlpA